MRALLTGVCIAILLLCVVDCNKEKHDHHKTRHGNSGKLHHSAKSHHGKLHHAETKHQHKHQEHHMKREASGHHLRQAAPPANSPVEVCAASCTQDLQLNSTTNWAYNLYGTAEVIVYYSAKSDALLVLNLQLKVAVIYFIKSQRNIVVNIATGGYLVVSGNSVLYGTTKISAEQLTNDSLINLLYTITVNANFSGNLSIKLDALLAGNFNGNTQLQTQIRAHFQVLLDINVTIGIDERINSRLYVRIFGSLNINLSAAYSTAITASTTTGLFIFDVNLRILRSVTFVSAFALDIVLGKITSVEIAFDGKLSLVVGGSKQTIYLSVTGSISVGLRIVGPINSLISIGISKAVNVYVNISGSLSIIGTIIIGGNNNEVTTKPNNGSVEVTTPRRPVTNAPVTNAPVTNAPVTNAPVTNAPVTNAPVTNAPVTNAPVTNAPVTNAPVTNAPVTNAPVTNAPVTDAPVTNAPVTNAPVTDAPVTDAPVTDAPVTDAPVTDAPDTDSPVTDAPVTDAPVTDAPVTDGPVTNAPVTDAPTSSKPTEVPTPRNNDSNIVEVCSATCTKELKLNSTSNWILNIYGNSEVIIYYSASNKALLVYNTALNVLVVFLTSVDRIIIVNIKDQAYLVIAGNVAVYGQLTQQIDVSKFDVAVSVLVQFALNVNVSGGISLKAVLGGNFNGKTEFQLIHEKSFKILVGVNVSLKIETQVDVKYLLYVNVFGRAFVNVSAALAAVITDIVYGIVKRVVTAIGQVILNSVYYVLTLAGNIATGAIVSLQLGVDFAVTFATAAAEKIVLATTGIITAAGKAVGSIVANASGLLNILHDFVSELAVTVGAGLGINIGGAIGGVIGSVIGGGGGGGGGGGFSFGFAG